ncbi:MAG: uracil-DNA glycosylase [Rikenellaceae bacterium]
MEVKIEQSWKSLLAEEFEKDYFVELTRFVREQYSTAEVFPAAANIFRAFDACSVDRVKVVIIGQDPYHGEGQANGLCFSVGDGVRFPPSLVNIFKEIEASLGIAPPSSGDLGRWAEQGVLMLNSVLTVEAHRAASHQGRGWERFTDAVVKALSSRRSGLVYMLWGSYAQKKGAIVDGGKNLVLRSVHPSPLSAYRGFFGCNHFALANQYLEQHSQEPIRW